MELKEKYTTFEIEKYLNQLNEVLRQEDNALIICPKVEDDGSYTIRATKECMDDTITLASKPRIKRENLVMIECEDSKGNIKANLYDIEHVLGVVDSMRANGYSPRLAKIYNIVPTIQELIDCELLHKMMAEATKKTNDEFIQNNFKVRKYQRVAENG